MKDSQPIPLLPLLELTASQLEVALQSASAQLERLAGSVATFARLGAEIGAHPDAAVAELGASVAAEAQRAMFSMQFHDQLVQRLRHVRDALGDVHDGLSAPVMPPSRVLLAAIRSRYTMEDERKLFDVMLAHLPGAPRANADSEHESLRGSVELF
jgi:hypothetical protein